MVVSMMGCNETNPPMSWDTWVYLKEQCSKGDVEALRLKNLWKPHITGKIVNPEKITVYVKTKDGRVIRGALYGKRGVGRSTYNPEYPKMSVCFLAAELH